jgi:hypothetical protein
VAAKGGVGRDGVHEKLQFGPNQAESACGYLYPGNIILSW